MFHSRDVVGDERGSGVYSTDYGLTAYGKAVGVGGVRTSALRVTFVIVLGGGVDPLKGRFRI